MRKTILVTGSTSNIGEKIIEKFAYNNYNIVIHYNKNKEKAEQIKEKLNKYNIDSIIVQADITKEEEIKEMIDKVIKHFNRIDVLINNAACEVNTNFFDKTKEEFQKVLDVNLIGSFLVSKYVSKYMLENKYGKIINITSNNALDKYDPNTLEYDASKTALISLTHNLAKYLSPYVNVNAIAPGWVLTDKIKELDKSLNGKFIEEESKKNLLNCFATPEDIANLAYFLASDEAKHINSEIIKIDGGC